MNIVLFIMYFPFVVADQIGVDSELEISVKSLSVVLNRAEYEVAKAVMTNLKSRLVSMAGSGFTETEASVGSFVLYDLSPYHSSYYRERLITAGLKLSMSKYVALNNSTSSEHNV